MFCRTCCFLGEAVCAEIVVNTAVFIRFSILRALEFWVVQGRLRAFLVTLETLVVIFKGVGSRLEF